VLAGAAILVALPVCAVLLRLLPLVVADEAGLRLLRPAGTPPGLTRLRTAALLIGTVPLAACAPLVIPATAGTAVLLAAGWGAGAGAAPLLARIDLRIRRLPDRIVLPLVALTAVLWLCVLLLAPGTPASAAAGAALLLGPACGAAVLLVSLLGGRGRGLAIGLGDVKLAVLLGLLAGLAGVSGVLAAFVIAQASAVVEALWRLLVRREGRGARLAYGPHLLLGMWAGPVAVAALG
jgi:leader peptidase (prepilin peptidase)/N-methyltransferase